MDDKRARIFDFIVEYKQQHDGCAPSYGEIATGIEMPRPTVVDNVRAMVADGWLDKIPGKAGGLMVVGGEWMWRGLTVQSGS